MYIKVKGDHHQHWNNLMWGISNYTTIMWGSIVIWTRGLRCWFYSCSKCVHHYKYNITQHLYDSMGLRKLTSSKVLWVYGRLYWFPCGTVVCCKLGSRSGSTNCNVSSNTQAHHTFQMSTVMNQASCNTIRFRCQLSWTRHHVAPYVSDVNCHEPGIM